MRKRGQYLLGLDAGNTVIKAVIFDLEGKQIARSAKDGQSSTPAAGHVERDLSELWSNAKQVIRDCISEAGIDAKDIVGVGCAGHGNGLYLLDKSNHPMLGIQSLDTRAAGTAAKLNAQEDVIEFHKLCLQYPWPSQTPTLLAWIKENRPEQYAQIGTVLLCKDYITFQLTGQLASDVSDMSGCGLLRMPECTYEDRLLELYGLQDAKPMLPRLVDPTEVVGTINEKAAAETGLSIGTPVVGGLFDVVASALGSGVVNNGQASIIAGTWSINQVLSEQPANDTGIFMVSGFGPNRFVNIEASATSAANLEWYVREFVERGAHHDDPFGFCNEKVAQVEPSEDDPIYHPYLYGSGQGAEMRAGFYGLAGWHTEGHMLRALFEGVVFEHRRHIESLQHANLQFNDVILSGGGSRSPIWPQIFADCLGKPMQTAACEETGALGAAIVAGQGAGVFESLEASVDAMTSAKSIFSPNSEMKQHYDRRYAVFSDLTKSMADFWNGQDTNKE